MTEEAVDALKVQVRCMRLHDELDHVRADRVCAGIDKLRAELAAVKADSATTTLQLEAGRACIALLEGALTRLRTAARRANESDFATSDPESVTAFCLLSVEIEAAEAFTP